MSKQCGGDGVGPPMASQHGAYAFHAGKVKTTCTYAHTHALGTHTHALTHTQTNK